MFESLGWIAFLIMAMAMLYRYLKNEHSKLEQSIISVSGVGISPHLERIMFDMLADIQRRVAEEKQAHVLPSLAPGQFGFNVIVEQSDEDEGYIASSPQFQGCTAWGPTIEYAVHEFGMALRLFVQIMIEDGETVS